MPRKSSAQTSLNHTLAGISSLRNLSTTSSEDSAQALLELSIALVDSAIDILDKHLSTDKEVKYESQLLPGGTPGKHFRHVIETYRAFLLPLQVSEPILPPGPVEINYDAILPSSRRDTARSLGTCRRAMGEIKKDLRAWEERSRGEEEGLAGEMRKEVVLVAITPTRQEVASSIGRELWFCSLHAIHHFSMLRTIVVHELGIELPIEFGTAPSTILYRKDDWKPPPEKKEIRIVKSKL